MKYFSLLLVLLICCHSSYSQNIATNDKNPVALKYGNTISASNLKELITVIAADSLEGRKAGEKGQKIAAEFIVNYFRKNDLKPPVSLEGKKTYNQTFKFYTVASDTYVKINGHKYKKFDKMGHLNILAKTKEIKTKVFFVGKGDVSDFNEVDVRGKSVFMLCDNLVEKNQAHMRARKAGAINFFIVSKKTDEEFKNHNRGMFRMISERTYLKKPKLNSEKNGMFLVSPVLCDSLFGKSYVVLRKLIEEKASGNKKAFDQIKPVKLSYKLNPNIVEIQTENVLGYLEGTDLKDELIVVSSHYDHIGIRNGLVYNGADDDASGTSAIMEIAQAFAQAKKDGNGPRRSILFICFSAEESGLFGSEYYVDNAVFPLKKTIVNLNADMIGRIGDDQANNANYVSLVGSDKLSSELHEISEITNSIYTNLELDYTYNSEDHPDRVYYRGDHWNFVKKDIPVIFYSSGEHEDYHKPTDTVDRIEFELLTRRAKLIFFTAWELANREERPSIDKSK